MAAEGSHFSKQVEKIFFHLFLKMAAFGSHFESIFKKN